MSSVEMSSEDTESSEQEVNSSEEEEDIPNSVSPTKSPGTQNRYS